MKPDSDILDLLRAESIEAERKAQRALIIQPGAIGDSMLTLPLAAFLKEALHLGVVDVLGHTEYVGILPGRTCINRISSIDSVELHRLFIKPESFNLADRDPLLHAFAGYTWIVTFMGEPGSDFEQNLIFTANCTHSTEVVTLPLKPPNDYSGHLIDFHIRQFINQTGLPEQAQNCRFENDFIKVTNADINKGTELLKETGLDPGQRPIVIHPGSGSPNKSWHIENFLEIARELSSCGKNVVFLLGPAEMEKFSAATIRKIKSLATSLMDLSFPQVLRLLSCARIFIGNDSGITHLAAMSGIRTIAVFGPTNPNVYRPVGSNVSVLTGNSRTFAKKPSPKLQRELLAILES
ncbi:MAG: glycosyltransferase family 9 protein [Sedimentisphaerales bacterium]|nr:glycosyltransferase family 9 protein [Sedimentisphaerales bacterium]